MFTYPEFDNNGEKVLCSVRNYPELMQDISVFQFKPNQEKVFFSDTNECAVLLIDGKVRITTDGIDEEAERHGLFDDYPTTVHVGRKTALTVKALTDARFIWQSTKNDRDFPAKIYRKKDVIRTVSCEGMWENTAVRDVNTIFDYDNAPYSNLVIGEVLARQGRWWSYVPHSHPQPEVYYYEFLRPEGFGACFIGDEAHTIKDGSVGGFIGGKTHVQVTAPGFPMYNVWMIRHLDDNPWKKTRVVDPQYEWLDNNPTFKPIEEK